MSGTLYGATWELKLYADDVQGMGRYAWAEAVWKYLVDANHVHRVLLYGFHTNADHMSLLVKVKKKN